MGFNIEAPWNTFWKMVDALFSQDDDISIGNVYEPENSMYDYAFNIEVKSHEKFVALDRVIPSYKIFGNVTLGIFLFDEENNEMKTAEDLYKAIFKGNPIVKDIRSRGDGMGFEHSYVRFQPEVIQFFDDDISDFDGNWTGLAEDIARELFTEDRSGMNFCTANIHENDEAEVG